MKIYRWPLPERWTLRNREAARWLRTYRLLNQLPPAPSATVLPFKRRPANIT